MIGIGPGAGPQELVNRMLADRENNVLFAYNIEAMRGSSPNTVTIRIRPISEATETGYLKRSKNPGPAGHLPTVASIREFANVKIGEVVTLDLLFNTQTGEKIYDVLRPITDPPPAPGRLSVSARPSRETISLREIAVRVNGLPVTTPPSWLIGSAMRIENPGHGTYIVSAYNPEAGSFAGIAHADGKTLSWAIDGKYVEITSSTNILARSSNGILWVYHDKPDRGSDPSNAVRIIAADSVDLLLPKN